MISIIKFIGALAFVVFWIDWFKEPNKPKRICNLFNHKWCTNDGCTFCERCLEPKPKETL